LFVSAEFNTKSSSLVQVDDSFFSLIFSVEFELDSFSVATFSSVVSFSDANLDLLIATLSLLLVFEKA
jgi:hypothetical protein